MYLKTVILFFCVELYFLQCHCNPEQLATINTIFWDYARSKGCDNDWSCINLKGVADIIELVARRLHRPYEPFRFEDLKEIGSLYRYSVEDCKRYVKKLLNCTFLNQAMEHVIDDLYNDSSCQQQDGISFVDLKTLLGRIPAGYNDSPPKFSYLEDAKTAVPYKLSRSDFSFSSDEVLFIVIDFFFPGMY